MKLTHCPLTALIFLFGTTVAAPLALADEEANPSAASASVAREPGSKLDALQAEYERRRAEALRPVTLWYRAELEALGRSLARESATVATTQAQVAADFWQDDQPELRHALLQPGWLWRSEENTAGVALKFDRAGGVHHSGLEGTWKITGPCEVTVWPQDDGRYLLRFNASLQSFTGDRRGVAGNRPSR